ncbi:MAG TPA: hypothetical protein VFR91_08395 [Dyella sp.]|nr:hypothetical protein [Dyella sp.]
MQAPLDAPETGSPAHPSPSRRAPGAMAVALQVAADTGYGIWALEGTGLALGIYRSGRGESLVPLLIGLLLVSAGLLVASLRRPGWPDWYGWRPGRAAWPTREALTALATYLPMLAVAGLTRGDNDFWATRLAGAALMMACLGHLLYSTHRLPGRTPGPAPVAALPVGRVMAAMFGGGLWLWLCVAADSDVAVGPALPEHQSWLLVLLVMALLLGLIEGMRWHALRSGTGAGGREHARLPRGRFVAALLSHALPCLALLLADRWQAGGLLAGSAALSNLVGRAWEQWLYRRECARSLDGCSG